MNFKELQAANFSVHERQRIQLMAQAKLMLMDSDDINYSDVMNDVYIPFLSDFTRTQIFFGGSSSGKSVFLAQRAVLDTLFHNRNYLIARKVARTIATSTFAEVKKAIKSLGFRGRFQISEYSRRITSETGHQMIFIGLDDLEKVKSITPDNDDGITDVWFEEGTEGNIPDDIKLLFKRQRGGDPAVPKRFTISFNPIYKGHPLYKNYFSGWSDDNKELRTSNLVILKTTYADNKFLTPGDIYDLENEADEYYRNVYTYGMWGVLGDVIFKNWEVRDLSGMRDQFTNPYHGLDFGFSADPAAIAATHYDRKRSTIYLYDELYERELLNDELAGEAIRICGDEAIVGDSAEPKSIKELRRNGVRIRPAKKGKDSVNHGINWLRGQKIIIDKSCVNAIREFETYQWAKDKDGNSLRRPVDRDNHIIDALRYAYEYESLGRKSFYW